MSVSFHPWSEMPEEVQRTLRTYLGQLRREIGDHLEGVILYGSLARGEYVQGRSNINLLVIIRQFSIEIGRRCGSLHRRWGKDRVLAPLMMTEEELRTSLDVFPLEYLDMKYHHVLLEGRDPFPELHLNESNLKAQCQQELMGNVLRVRQRFIEGEGRVEAIQALLLLSITALIPCLRGLLRMFGHSSTGTAVTILEGLPKTLQVDPTVFQEVLNLKRGLSSPGTKEFPRLLERYLKALQGLMKHVRELKAEESV